MLAKIIKAKYIEIKKELIKREIRLGSTMIMGHNWKIKVNNQLTIEHLRV